MCDYCNCAKGMSYKINEKYRFCPKCGQDLSKMKPLEDYTLKEVKAICKEHDMCLRCPLKTERDGCIFTPTPGNWSID